MTPGPSPRSKLSGALLAPSRIAGRSASLRVRLLLTLYWTANIVLLAITIAGFIVSDSGYDWLIYAEAGHRLGNGTLYAWEGAYAWSYSPLLAWVFAVIAPIGYVGWSVVHVAALAALRDRWLVAIVALSWPFWADVYNGNTMTFVLVAALGTLRGSRLSTGLYLLLFLLMPRPLMLPLAVWIVWQRPAWRLPALGMLLVMGAAVLVTGYATEWASVLVGVNEAVANTSRDIGPSRILGIWWLPLGLILAALLLSRRHMGLASIAISPYWLPQYLLMGYLELVRPEPMSSPSQAGRRFPGRRRHGAKPAVTGT